MLYIIADGRHVGKEIYQALVEGDNQKAKKISNSINNAIAKISKVLSNCDGIDLIFAGGDDICCLVAENKKDFASSLICEMWQQETGLLIDIAFGSNQKEALRHLEQIKSKKIL